MQLADALTRVNRILTARESEALRGLELWVAAIAAGLTILIMAWFKNGRFRVALGISARTLIGPARWSGFT